MSQKVLSTIVVAVVIIGVAGFGAYTWWQSTPQYALSQIKQAYETHDVDLALQYIDIDSIFDDLWVHVQQEITSQVSESENEWEALGAMLGQSMMEGMKPVLKEQVRTQLVDSVKNAASTTSISSLVSTYTITKEGDDVVVSGTDSELKLRMKKSDDGWRIVAIEGLFDGIPKKTEAPTETVSLQENTEPKAEASKPSVPVTPKSYQQVFTFSGNGAKKSEPFTITGDRFKIVYDCNGDPVLVLCQAFVYEISNGIPQIIMNSTEATKDETIIYGKGEYYLDANVLGSYTMTVYDYK